MSDSPSPETPFRANPAVHDPFQAAKASALKAPEALRNAAADLRSEAEKFAREKPLQALATAFGAGLLLGMLLRR